MLIKGRISAIIMTKNIYLRLLMGYYFDGSHEQKNDVKYMQRAPKKKITLMTENLSIHFNFSFVMNNMEIFFLNI